MAGAALACYSCVARSRAATVLVTHDLVTSSLLACNLFSAAGTV